MVRIGENRMVVNGVHGLLACKKQGPLRCLFDQSL